MAVYTQQVLSPDPLYLQPKSYSAQADRKPFADILSPGVVGSGDFLVSLTSGMGISVAAGAAWILGQNIADQGLYRQYVTGANTLTVGAADGTYPRLDQVIMRVMDNAADASTYNETRIEIVPGTPSSGATLDNRTGAANLTTLGESSKSVLLIADILVPTGAGSLSAGNLRDRRPRASVGSGLALLGFPVGTILLYAGSTAPVGGLWCDGASYSRYVQKPLFDVIGYTYGGSGDNFNVPDTKGRAPIGVGTGSGLTARALAAKVGAETHGLVAGELPGHAHSFTPSGAVQNNYAGASNIVDQPHLGTFLEPASGDVASYRVTGWVSSSHGHTFVGNAGNIGNGNGLNGSLLNNMQPSIALNFVIRA